MKDARARADTTTRGFDRNRVRFWLFQERTRAQMKNLALNTMIDIAENDYKFEIRKKSGPKQ
jgi:hypothetical protein